MKRASSTLGALVLLAPRLLVAQPAENEEAAGTADPVSVVAFRAHLDAAKLEALIEPRIPIIGDGAAFPRKRQLGSGVCGTYYFDRKPVGVRFAGAGGTLTIAGGFGAIASPHGGFLGCLPPEVSCGNKAAGVPPVPMSVGIAAAMSLADDYSLSVRLQNQGVRFLEPCRLAFGGIDASQLAKNLIDEKINSRLAELTELVGRQISVRDAAERFWPTLQQPFDAGPGATLQLYPSGISQAVSADSPRRLTVEMDVAMRPVLTLGAPRAPAAAPADPLPTLAAADPDARRGLTLRVEHHTKVSSLEEKVTRALAAPVVNPKGRPLTVASARLSPSGRGLALDIETKDHGTFHYDAAPTIAADGARIGLKLSRPVKGSCERECADLLPAFESALSWPAADLSAAARRAVETGMNRTLAPGMALKTDLRDKLSGCSARVDGDRVVFVMPFRGDARVDWEVEIP